MLTTNFIFLFDKASDIAKMAAIMTQKSTPSDPRLAMRQQFLDAWRKHQCHLALSDLECQIRDVILLHPEYQLILKEEETLDQDYRTDNNPFLHMSLHLGLTEQLTTNRPAGIREIYQQLYNSKGDEHRVQHLMMEAMAEVIYEAQQNGSLPDEQAYLERLSRLTTA